MNQINVTIIGAGGVASYLAPVISRFQVADVHTTIMDGDILEERNIDRQLFSSKDIGRNKALALLKYAGLDRAITKFLTPNSVNDLIGADPDVIFCLVDNDKARALTYEVAMDLKVPMISAANEMFDASARISLPEFYKTDKCLFNINPDLLSPDPTQGINCTGRMTEEFPQLAMANQMAAAFALHLFYIHLVEDFSDEVRNELPLEFSRTLTAYQGKTRHET